MTPRPPKTLIEVLRSTLAELEQHEQRDAEALRELKRSVTLTIAALDRREDGDSAKTAA